MKARFRFFVGFPRGLSLLGGRQRNSNRYVTLVSYTQSCCYTAENGSSRTPTKQARLSFVRPIWRVLRWVPVPFGLGVAFISLQSYRQRKGIHDEDCRYIRASKWEVTCYRLLPLKTFSRVWGWVNSINLPTWARKPVLSLYAKSFGVNLSEAETEDLREYRNLGEFFRRAIKPHVRPVDTGSMLVSPCDGRIVHFGRVEQSNLEQVKGISYSLQTFLGPVTWSDARQPMHSSEAYQSRIMEDPINNELFHCVIYLAPGDYHRFHSPLDWEVTFRRHFSGELFSVSPNFARWIAGLFSLNERAVYVGRWAFGFFSMTAVGATNVGSIRVGFDKDLSTNVFWWRKGTHHDHNFVHGEKETDHGCGVHLYKGAPFGEFNLGSTIVLIFEAPKDFQFCVETGSRIMFGQPLQSSSCECPASDENAPDLNVTHSCPIVA